MVEAAAQVVQMAAEAEGQMAKIRAKVVEAVAQEVQMAVEAEGQRVKAVLQGNGEYLLEAQMAAEAEDRMAKIRAKVVEAVAQVVQMPAETECQMAKIRAKVVERVAQEVQMAAGAEVQMVKAVLQENQVFPMDVKMPKKKVQVWMIKAIDRQAQAQIHRLELAKISTSKKLVKLAKMFSLII